MALEGQFDSALLLNSQPRSRLRQARFVGQSYPLAYPVQERQGLGGSAGFVQGFGVHQEDVRVAQDVKIVFCVAVGRGRVGVLTDEVVIHFAAGGIDVAAGKRQLFTRVTGLVSAFQIGRRPVVTAPTELNNGITRVFGRVNVAEVAAFAQ